MKKPLQKYNMIRRGYNPSDISLLMGNGEIGGLADKLGRGFEMVWGASFWKDETTRFALNGPLCKNEFSDQSEIESYYQELALDDGQLTTRVSYNNGYSYESRIFFSMVDKTSLVIQIKNPGIQNQLWSIQLPKDGFTIREIENGEIRGKNEGAFTQLKWKAIINLPADNVSNGVYSLAVPPNTDMVIFFSVISHWLYAYQGRYEKIKDLKFEQLYQEQRKEWEREWNQVGTLFVPDEDVLRLFYRSLFFMLITTGSYKFLPGEQQFVEPSWDMHPFTYGAAGWSVLL